MGVGKCSELPISYTFNCDNIMLMDLYDHHREIVALGAFLIIIVFFLKTPPVLEILWT